MKISYLIRKAFILLILAVGLNSCQDTFELLPKNVLVPSNHFQTVDDANKAIIGVYSQLYTIANQYIILNELRADLLDVTDNSDKYLNELSMHGAISKENPYADPRPFYKIINNCNDIIKNLNKMMTELRIKDQEYKERISDMIAIRSWLYFQLSLHFDAVPYITEPFENVNDIKAFEAYSSVGLSDMIDTLVLAMEGAPVLTTYTTFPAVIDGYNMANGSWFDKSFFMAELYMWQGKYRQALNIYRNMFISPSTSIDAWSYHIFAGFNNYSTGFGYNNLFTDIGRYYTYENVWNLFFDANFAQNNSFVNLFAIDGGNYVLKPSEISKERWRLFPGGPNADPRGENMSWKASGSQSMVNKMIIEYNSTMPWVKAGRWWIYRQSSLHLHYSECANRDNHPYLAWVLVNGGMTQYHPTMKHYIDSTYRHTGEPFPYDLSGLQTNEITTVDGYSIAAGNFLRNAGIRGRAGMPFVNVSAPTTADSINLVENMILDESGLELAYEGHRWPDLVRIALRKNDPSVLADRIYQKFQKANHPSADAIRTKLMDSNNWFIPFPKN